MGGAVYKKMGVISFFFRWGKKSFKGRDGGVYIKGWKFFLSGGDVWTISLHKHG